MEIQLPVPLRFRRGGLREDEAASVISALTILDYVNTIAPLADSTILDFGCGVKLAQGLLQKNYGHRKYVGVDVFGDMISYLKSKVTDSRFSFGSLNFRNDMYNKDGEPMTGASRLPIDDDEFGLITMFSVITHMNPADAEAALRILRGYAAADAHLIFSTFVDADQAEPFIDLVPERPLRKASFRRAYLEEIIQRAGWYIQEYRRPAPRIQQHYICRPAKV